jgi:hypothetical protein
VAGRGLSKKKISGGESGAACVARAAVFTIDRGRDENPPTWVGGLVTLPHVFFCHNPEFSDFNYDSISLKLYPKSYSNYDNVYAMPSI